jgi:hypothetical protein
MNLKRLLNTGLGKFFISLLLGLGLATLFRKVCTDKNCITFNGPVISEIDGKIYKYGEKCYKYVYAPSSCDATKKIVDISSDQHSGNPAVLPNLIQKTVSSTTSPEK